jgi:hypothetical protein
LIPFHNKIGDISESQLSVLRIPPGRIKKIYDGWHPLIVRVDGGSGISRCGYVF